MSLLVVPLVLRPSFSSTLSTMPVPVLPMTPSHPRVEELVNSTAWWMSTERPSLPMVLPVSTVDSFPQSSESSCTVVSTSVSTIRSVRMFMCLFCGPCFLTTFVEPVVLVGALEGSFLASFGLGWGVTIGAGLASYPLDTIRYVPLFLSLAS